MIQIIGSPISPYVKKVLTLLLMKGVDFEVDPITPFFGNDQFTELSPLRRIPVFIDGNFVLNDSTVIAEYIEECWPSPAALPGDPNLRAQARWLEEYSDSKIGDEFIWKSFAQIIVAPFAFKKEPDHAAFEANLEAGVADVMNYLEKQMPDEKFLVGEFGLADISIAAMFRNMHYVKWGPDEKRWPKTAAWLQRCEMQPALAKANEWSDALFTVKPPERRALAEKIGLKLTTETVMQREARRGPMTVIG
ncbi:MAG: glutathione S-transferase family protein [Marinicaulis sp.]|nr:glutathione S-transferase family protein [Marinicaulis sp.]NNE39350.1 glutathione S-transferase family protein [Marinicaulis sp.]NNL89161.1 glutathione S-transferase family protein [Marinicaulis sp.]